MELISEIQKFYEKHNFKNHLDYRSEEQKARQAEIVEKICQRNLDVMKSKLTEKKSVRYNARPLERIDLGEGVYCYVTDNRVESDQTIMTIHGLLGSCSEWAGLETEMKEKVRWVNFTIPGFDGEDERRGNYVGDHAALLDLIIKLKRKLKITRMIICGHSYGSLVAFNLKDKYPGQVEGYINLAGTSNYWSFGVAMVYKLCIAEFGYYDQEWNKKQFYNIDEKRQKIYQRYVNFYKQKNYQALSVPFFKKDQLMTYIKLTNSPIMHQDKVFDRYKQLPDLRLVVFAQNDPFHTAEKIESTLHFLIREEQSYTNRVQYRKLFDAAKIPMEARLKEIFGIQVEGENIQEYFCFILGNTGHSIHRRRPEELAKIIAVYLTALQVLHQQSQLIISKL